MDERLILVSLMIKLGVAAAIASVLVRSHAFQRLLFKEERRLGERVKLLLFLSIPAAIGVLIRQNVNTFAAADIAFEAALLAGTVAGRLVGVAAGVIVSIPALAAGEVLALPLHVGAGFIAGLLRKMASDYEAIWSFSPLFDLSIYRWIRSNLRRPLMDWQTAFFLTILGLSVLYVWLHAVFPSYLFAFDSDRFSIRLAIYATSVMAVGIPLKIWNNSRIQIKLEHQERLLLQARMEALQSQINPHFLFNTLNSVASLVRFDPDTARELVVKLASILRRLLRKGDSFVALREEFDFVDDYLDIEVVRFGRDKLRVEKDLDPASLEVVVPSMILQPLVENSVKHGIAPRIEGGSIHLRSRVNDGIVEIEIEDDGVGMHVHDGGQSTGIGMTNVAARLRVLYGDAATLTVEAPDGSGTRVRLRIPVLRLEDPTRSAAEIIYEARSTTSR